MGGERGVDGGRGVDGEKMERGGGWGEGVDGEKGVDTERGVEWETKADGERGVDERNIQRHQANIESGDWGKVKSLYKTRTYNVRENRRVHFDVPLLAKYIS